MRNYKDVFDKMMQSGMSEEDIKFFKNLVSTHTPKYVHCYMDEIGDRDAFGGTGYLQFAVCECPNCESELEEYWSYCPYCGQALKREDEYEDY